MTLTKKDKRKLAKAARELAGEYAEGRGPALNPDSYCGCGAAEVVRRSAILPQTTRRKKIADVAYGIDIMLLDTGHAWVGLVSEGTTRQFNYFDDMRLPGAVVFSILALADVLEESAR